MELNETCQRGEAGMPWQGKTVCVFALGIRVLIDGHGNFDRGITWNGEDKDA